MRSDILPARPFVWLIIIGLLFLKSSSYSQTICIDPGHPSENGNGTNSVYISELKANWLTAIRLKEQLTGRRYQVVMTKKAMNEFVANRQRAEIANQAKAKLMIRLHCDATSGRGLTIFFPNQQGIKDGFLGPPMSIVQSSRQIAETMHSALGKSLGGTLPVHQLKTDCQTRIGSRQGALTGSIFSRVPIILIEMVNLSDNNDACFITTKNGQLWLAQAMAEAIDRVFH